MRLAYLSDYPQHIEQLAAWQHAQWGHMNYETPEQRLERLRIRARKDRLPITVIAMIDGQLAGSASLDEDDMDTHPELQPWLASVFVSPVHRNHGIGSALVGWIEEEATSRGFARFYLFTPDKEAFYARRGWRTIAREPYRGEEVTIMEKVLTNDKVTR